MVGSGAVAGGAIGALFVGPMALALAVRLILLWEHSQANHLRSQSQKRLVRKEYANCKIPRKHKSMQQGNATCSNEIMTNVNVRLRLDFQNGLKSITTRHAILGQATLLSHDRVATLCVQKNDANGCWGRCWAKDCQMERGLSFSMKVHGWTSRCCPRYER